MSLLTKEETIELRKKYIASTLSVHYSSYQPLKIVRGRGVYFYDENEQRYIDCINNVALVGHSHPKLVEAMHKYMTHPNLVLKYDSSCDTLFPSNQQRHSYTSKILSTLPGSGLDTMLFVRSGSEANDLALVLAEAATGHTEIIAIDGAYHGHSKDLIGLSTYKLNQLKIPGLLRQSPNAHIAMLPDILAGKYRDPSTAGELYALEVKHLIDRIQSEDKKVAAFICESFLGCGGQIPLPSNYLKAVLKYIHDAGGLCIVDEVQTGFGRCGKHFWMHQMHPGAYPDILVIGKPMGNGHPISAVVTRHDIVEKFTAKYGNDILHEFTSDPVSIAIGEAVFDVIREERLQDNAVEVGSYLMTKLRFLKDKHKCIGDVRGTGLFIGVLIEDARGKPDMTMTLEIVKQTLLDHNVLLKEDGLNNNIIKIKPPLCFTKENADTVVMAIDDVITNITKLSK